MLIKHSSYWLTVVIVWFCITTQSLRAQPNEVVNPNFDWPGYTPGGVTTTNVFAYNAQYWGGGPGANGATATYDVLPLPAGTIPGDPSRYMRINWSVPPKTGSGEGLHLPQFRGTFLENFFMQDAHRFSGETVNFSFWARVPSGQFRVVPLMWHSYGYGVQPIKGIGYELYESSGVPGVVQVALGAPHPAAAVTLDTQWRHFEVPITFPDLRNVQMTNGHYTGVGFDYLEKGFPGFEIAQPTVTRTWGAPSTSYSPYRTAVLDQGPTSYWQMDDVTATGGDHFVPTVGGNATLQGGATVANGFTQLPGAPINGVSGSNRSAWVRPTNVLPTDAKLYLTDSSGTETHDEDDPFSIVAWVRHVGTSANLANRAIVSASNANGNGNGNGIRNPYQPGTDGSKPGWHLYANDSDTQPQGASRLAFQISDGGADAIDFTSTKDIQDGYWHMVAVTYNGSPTDVNAVKLYANGVLQSATRTVYGNAATLDITTAQLAQQVLAIGNVPGMANGWDGPIDEVAMFHKVLTSGNIADLYAASFAHPTPITPISAVASSEYLDTGGIYGGVQGDLRKAMNTIDGSGLTDGGTYGLHSRSLSASGSGATRNPGAHWMSGDGATPTITWDLGSAHDLTGFHLWNYGEQDGYETRGVKSADILVSSDGTNFTTVLSGQQFLETPATGAFPGDDYTLITDNVRYVRFNVLTTHGDTNFAGLSEIRFFGSALAGVAGDYNGDGTVNTADYTVWRDNLGGTSLPNEGGISPGIVDQEDYNFWKSRYGATSASGNGAESTRAVPEPCACFLMLAGVLVGWLSGIGGRNWFV